MNMKRILLTICLFASVAMTWAQKPVSAAEQKEMIRKVEAAAAKTTSLKSSFEQVKQLSIMNSKMVSKGEMSFRAPDKLRWEYLTPYSYIFILNGGKGLLKSSKSKNVVDVKQSAFFQEIAQIMMSSMTGKCLSDDSRFKVTMYKNGDMWQASLTPLNKTMKKMFSAIKLHIDPVKNIVNAVQMVEVNGDTTTITLSNTKTNESIQEKVFAID